MLWGAFIDFLLCILVSEKLVLGSNDRGVHMYNSDEALKNSYRMVKEGGMDAIKLEVSMRYFQGQEDELPEAY